MSGSDQKWQWESATAGAVAGFATVASLHPLDVVRTRFQVNDGRVSHLPLYKNTVHAIYTIARMEGFKGVYAGFYPAVLGSTVSWSLYFFFYGIAKNRHSKGGEKKLTPGLHLLSAAEAGALVSMFTNPIWVVKTRLQLQNPLIQNRPYSGFKGMVGLKTDFIRLYWSFYRIRCYEYGSSCLEVSLRFPCAMAALASDCMVGTVEDEE